MKARLSEAEKLIQETEVELLSVDKIGDALVAVGAVAILAFLVAIFVGPAKIVAVVLMGVFVVLLVKGFYHQERARLLNDRISEINRELRSELLKWAL